MARSRTKRAKPVGETYALPTTVSQPALLDGGSDERFRRLIYDLLTIAARMDKIRAAVAGRVGVTGPQYSLLMAVGEGGSTRVSAIADRLHVSTAFVTIEAGKLARRGLVVKTANPEDGRSVLLSLTPRAASLIAEIGPEVRAVNDRFFGRLDRSEFVALGRVAETLVADSIVALDYVAAPLPRLRDGAVSGASVAEAD